MGKFALLLVAAAFIGGGIMLFQSNQLSASIDQRQSDYGEEVIAQEIAASAYQAAYQQVERQALAGDIALAVSTVQTTGTTKAYQGGTLGVTAQSVAGKPSIRVVAKGEFGSKVHNIDKELTLTNPLKAAMSIIADGVSLTMNNNTKINGANDDNALPLNTVGVMVKSQAAYDGFNSGMAGNDASVRGLKSDGSVGNGSLNMDAAAISIVEDLYNEALGKVDQSMGAYVAAEVDNPHYFGSADTPAIVRITGDMTIEADANVRGYGMLIVEEDFRNLGGTFEWDGIVIVRKVGNEEGSLNVLYTDNTTINGSLILWHEGEVTREEKELAVDATFDVSYIQSSAGFCSGIWFDPKGPWAQDNEDYNFPIELFPSGSNRSGSQFSTFSETIPAGTQISFFMRVDHNCSYDPSNGPNTSDYDWDHHALGQTVPDDPSEYRGAAGKPWAEWTENNDTSWNIGFEDMSYLWEGRGAGVSMQDYMDWPGGCVHGSNDGGSWKNCVDWDYDDQVIQVDFHPAEGFEGDDLFWSYGTGEGGTGGGGTGGGGTTTEVAPIYLTINGTDSTMKPEVQYSFRAIAALAPRLKVVKDNITFTVTESQEVTSKKAATADGGTGDGGAGDGGTGD